MKYDLSDRSIQFLAGKTSVIKKNYFFPYYTCIFNLLNYFCTRNTEVAQSVEHWSPKPGVGSSSLSFRA